MGAIAGGLLGFGRPVRRNSEVRLGVLEIVRGVLGLNATQFKSNDGDRLS